MNTEPTLMDSQRFLARQSFIELKAWERVRQILDPGTFRELLGPFDRLRSPWLEQQGIVPQEDDGVIIGRGRIDGVAAVVAAIEGAFQGGSMGEVAGAKIVRALELARLDNEKGIEVRPVLLFETGGVRLQEANLGLAAIAEIHAAIVALREYVPVVGIIAGMVGCFGGMSLAASLCSKLIVTREARLGMNGPEVIEQEAGIEEFDASDRHLIWRINGGTQRYASGFADLLVEDDTREIARVVREFFHAGRPGEHRSARADHYLNLLARIDPSSPIEPEAIRESWNLGGVK